MDLNLVRVFVAVFESRSLTLASERLFVTQSAISQSLARLRNEFDDQLFERVAREMRPTPLAESIFPGFREALGRIDRTVEDVHGFDPSTSERTLRVAFSELGEIGWLPRIFRAVHRRAPGVRIEVVTLETERLVEWLQRGVVDLAVTPADLPGEFHRSRVKTQPYCVLSSVEHPLAGDVLSIGEYADSEHVVVSSDSGLPLLESAQRRAGLEVEASVAVQHVATLPQLLTENPHLLATIPETIAQGWTTTWPLRIRPLPFEMDPIELSLYRRSTTQNSSALEWFAKTVAPVLEASPGEFVSLHSLEGPEQGG